MSPAAVARALRRSCVVAALALSAVMVARSQPSGDQLNLLARGWLLAERGELVPWSNPISGGGRVPGAATSLAVGAPLELRLDHRAPVAAVWMLHLGALVLLARVLRPALAPLEWTAYLVLWTLGPWRLEAAATLWNPSYLFVAGAIHLATAAASRERARFGASFAHVATLGIAAQLHPSTLLLGVHSLLLWARGRVRVSWGGFAAGVAVAAATVLPWLGAAASGAGLFAESDVFLFRGLVRVYPWLKGIGYWFRSAGLTPTHGSLRYDFTEALGAGVDVWLSPLALGVTVAAGAAMLVAGLVANGLWLRRALPALGRTWTGGTDREWLSQYAAAALVAAVVVFAAAPTTPQAWQSWGLFHAGLLPVAFGAGRLAERFGERLAAAACVAVAVLALAVGSAMAFGSPGFRCSGRAADRFPLRGWSPMFEELGLQRDCPRALGVEGGWWPDVLPAEQPAAAQ